MSLQLLTQMYPPTKKVYTAALEKSTKVLLSECRRSLHDHSCQRYGEDTDADGRKVRDGRENVRKDKFVIIYYRKGIESY